MLFNKNLFSSVVGVSSKSPKLLSMILSSQIISKLGTKSSAVFNVLFKGETKQIS